MLVKQISFFLLFAISLPAVAQKPFLLEAPSGGGGFLAKIIKDNEGKP
jgi:hypothetical protein